MQVSTTSQRGAAAHLVDKLEAGHVYRREDLARLSNAIDRHLRELMSMGKLRKLAQGLYHAPKQSSFGPLPPADEKSIENQLMTPKVLALRAEDHSPAKSQNC